MGYRPHLDGLRGIAVSLVLVAHFVPPTAPFIGTMHGFGHVGVGLFFALSGYLITGLLLDERQRTGRVSLAGFYVRRAGRLVPGLVVMVACTSPLLAVAGFDIWHAGITTLTYTSNYTSMTGWGTPNGWAQTWSLAIEEHFYLLWAPALILANRRGTRAVLHTALIGAVLSAVVRVDGTLVMHSWIWAARGTFARGDALLVGCAAAAAVRLGWQPPRWMLPASAAALVLLCIYLPVEIDSNATKLAVSFAVLSWAAAGLVVGIDYRTSPAQRTVAVRPLVRLGVLSYSIYLWHFPLLVALDGRLPRVAILLLSLAVATASFHLIERPARAAVRRYETEKLSNRLTVSLPPKLVLAVGADPALPGSGLDRGRLTIGSRRMTERVITRELP